MKQQKVVLFLHFLTQVLLKIKIFLSLHNKTSCLAETHREAENEICLIPEENLHLSGYFYIGQTNLTLKSQYTNEKYIYK